jgi:hypothetical protein
VTKEESWAAVVAAATRHFGKLYVLVNNARTCRSRRAIIGPNFSTQLRTLS